MREEKLRKHGDQRSYPIYVWSGILEQKHRKRIGPALWEFLWCINRITKEPNGVGFVLGGMPVTFALVADELGISERTVRRHMDRLFHEGYVEPILTPRGYSLRVPNSCKFPKQNGQKWPTTDARGSKSTADAEPLTKVATEVGQKWIDSQADNGHPSDKSGLPNIRESSCSKQLEKAVEKTAAPRSSPSSSEEPEIQPQPLPTEKTEPEETPTVRIFKERMAQVGIGSAPKSRNVRPFTQAELDEQKRFVLEKYGDQARIEESTEMAVAP